MGERGQIQIGNVYLYTHWGGAELKETLKSALSRKQRWDDEEYLARIIFCEMIKGEEQEETGYGIGTSKHSDLNYPLLVVDIENQQITEKKGGEFDSGQKLMKKTSFEDFIK